MTEKQFNSLPKWAQLEINKRDQEIKDLMLRMENLEMANEVVRDMNWYIIGRFTPEQRTLFFLNKDSVTSVACVGAGSILLVGRPKKDDLWT